MPEQPKLEPFDLSPGLLEYYSSQAEIMLAQYENINRLLGPTDHWSKPGEFCEILFRDFLRKFLPPSLSADMGFAYGRTILGKEDIHSPEIDILIHDTEKHRPIFRMGDFVIVKPEAVRGVIQVKKALTPTQVRRGIANIVKTKLLLHRVWKGKEDWQRTEFSRRIFSAVIGFEQDMSKSQKGDKTANDIMSYKSCLLHWYQVQQREYKSWVLPSFIGSLQGLILLGIAPLWYRVYESHYAKANHRKENVFTQILLHAFLHILRHEEDEMPPFALPEDLNHISQFTVPEMISVIANADSTITIDYSDGTYKLLQRHPNQAALQPNAKPHLIQNENGEFETTEHLMAESNTHWIVVQSGDARVHYGALHNPPPR
jgi:hypothetical protein